MKKIILLSIVLLSLNFVNAQKANPFFNEKAWIYIYTNSRGDSIYIKDTPISVKNNIVKIWLRLKYYSKINQGNELFQIMEYNCEEGTNRSGYLSEYSYNKRCVRKGNSKIPGWVPVVPETIDDYILNTLKDKYIK